MNRRDLRVVLVLVAVFCALVLTLIGFGVDWPHPLGWLGASLAALSASFLA